MRRIILAWILCISLAVSFIPVRSFGAETKQVTEDNVAESAVADKTASSTTCELSNGANMTVIYSEEIRFEDENGNLVDYDPSLVKLDKKENGIVKLQT